MPTGSARRFRPLLLAVWGVSALYAFAHLDRGWIPHDEGTLAHSAERVLLGELPHRDFDEVYTGGLSALNAVAFRVMGVSLLTPRLLLFALFLAWVPTVYWIATRFTGPPTAALATLLAVSWSLPVYPAAMPSWYNLFLAVFGLAALLRHLESGERRWLFAAGVAGGLSILAKVSGLFFVASGLLFLAYREQHLSAAHGAVGPAGRGGRAFALFTTTALLAFVLVLAVVVGGRSGAAGWVHFVLPLAGVSLFLVLSGWMRRPAVSATRRLRTLCSVGFPFLGGVLVPVGALVLVYAASGAMDDLVRGLFELPTRRFSLAATPPPGVGTLWVALPLIGLLALEAAGPSRLRRIGAGVVLAAGGAAVVLPPSPAVFEPAWWLLNALGPVVVLGGTALVAAREHGGGDPLAHQRSLATLAVAGGVMLIQFPFSGAIYLFFTLPAVVLAALPCLGGRLAAERPVFVATMAVLLLFSARWVDTGEIFAAAGFAYDPTRQTERLMLPRGGGLRVAPAEKEEYERLVAALHELTTSEYTFATPDLPEVYFLSGLRNPTRTLFDFFDEPAGRVERILDGLDEHGVDVVVLNRRLRFSGPPPEELLAELRARYPRAALLGGFIVRWREPEP